MLVSTIGITAIVAVGIVGWRVVRGDGSEDPGRAGDWDQIALVNRSSGDTTFLDEDGQLVDQTVGSGRVMDVHVRDERLALVGPDRIVLNGVDAAEPTIVPIARNSSVSEVKTIDTFHLVIGDPSGGNVVVLDAATGETIDVGATAGQANPLMFAETMRHSTDGTTFAVADAANFQTILVRPGVIEPAFFPDQPIAVGTELIATSQVVGAEADVTLYDFERDNKATGTIEIPAGGVMVDDVLTLVSIDGAVYRLGSGDDEAERIGVVAVPAGETVSSVRPTFDGQRLVVAGAVFEAVIDLDGTTVFTTTFTTPVAVDEPAVDWTCLPVGGASAGSGSAAAGFHSIISLETGEQLADLTGLSVTRVASDGCTVIGERAGVIEVVGVGGGVTLGSLRTAALGPDGRTVVQQTTAGATELVSIDDEFELGEPIDLSEHAALNLTVAFLDS
ncbi:MAG: hypothetical protein QNJ12_22120 [Ilumatobacter sp.]|uniref:hypothetical protein n=1 Tax=Ilumatobacter sp. TaxID=1967498 RepID=UPI00263066CA|nr:hypothetical protein [Ilumatobacter sp.]MDJ0771499.1 hypothetical protein [Ilumatobacter sp.]